LGTLDDKIELNRRMNATLEGMAQALFKSWFVDFDPVIDNALAAGNPIPDELAPRAEVRKKALADGTANRQAANPFPAAFQQTESMGWIPEEWEVKTIGDLCVKIQNGGTPKRDNEEFWNNGTIPWLTSGEVRQSVILSVKNTITEYGLANSSAKWLPARSTVVAMYGATAGQVAFIYNKLTTNQAVCGLVPKEHFQYFNYLLIEGNVKHFENQARGSAQQNISKGIIEESAAIIPPLHVVQSFEDLAHPIFEKWAKNMETNDQLTKLRDTLLPKLISGELRIPEAEQLIEKT
jgi:type I restriction enzyme S subunit